MFHNNCLDKAFDNGFKFIEKKLEIFSMQDGCT